MFCSQRLLRRKTEQRPRVADRRKRDIQASELNSDDSPLGMRCDTEPSCSIASTGVSPATAFRAALTVGQSAREMFNFNSKFSVEKNLS